MDEGDYRLSITWLHNKYLQTQFGRTTMPTPPPSSATVDLTTSGNAGIINDGVFLTGQTQPAGTGNFNSFLRIQNTGTEQGYNTDGNLQFHEKDSHTHSLLLAEVPIVIGGDDPGTIEGVVYREFLLDLNEPTGGGKYFLSLDALQIWQQESGSLTNFNTSTGFAGAHTNYKAYDLDTGGNNWVALSSDISHGSGQSDVRVLIPDSVFINDAAHRYVYLYSALGGQSGDWSSGGGFEEWGLHGASGGSKSALNITKEASVPGGTADQDGEVITYSIRLFNTGNVALTGIAVSDPSVNDLTRGLDQVGNNDSILDSGEVWTYSAHYTVTQEDLDEAAIGGEPPINNTVSAGSDQTGHLPAQLDTASASVPVDARPLVELDKEFSSITSTDEAVGTTVVDAAGDVIHYTVSVSWAPNGNITLSGPVVTDPSINSSPVLDPTAPVENPNAQIFVQITDGDFNLGDDNNNGIVDPTDQNSARDPGETFQYVYIGDTDQDGFLDGGETWAYPAYNLGDTNNDGIRQIGENWVGDTNTNGVQEEGEKWQFKNLWDTNSNGLQDNDEIWHYQNIGDLDQNEVEDPGETFVYYNAGDTNQNGNEDAGETFQFYNVGDTNRNGEQDEGETFQFNTVLPGVETINPGFNDGDVNTDGKINENETWWYTASYIVTQDDIDNRVDGIPTVVEGLTHDNTASVVTDENATADGSASVTIDQNPAFSIEKTVTDVGGDGEFGHVDEAGDVIRYSIVITNNGNMTLTGVTLSDPLLTGSNGTLGAAVESGDADGELDVDETWTYIGTYTAQQSDINNNGGGDGDIDNTATAQVTQLEDQDPQSSSTFTLIDRNPAYSIVKTVTAVGGVVGPNGHVDLAGDVISYQIVVSNDGNVDLTGTSVSDPLLTAPFGTLSAPGGDTFEPGTLNVGEIWTYTGTYTAQQSDINNNGGGDGDIDNTATLQSDELADQTSSAAVLIDRNPDYSIAKTVTDVGGEGPNGHVDWAGDVITYSIEVSNLGNVDLTGTSVSDALLQGPNGTLSAATGDTFEPGTLNVGEVWTYTGTYTAQQSDIDNNGGGDGDIDNTATLQSDELADESSSTATLVDYEPGFTFTVNTLGYHDDNPTNNQPDVGEIIDFSAFVTNTGNVTLTNLAISDLDGTIIWSSAIASLAPLGTDTMTGTHSIQDGASGFDEVEIGQSDQVGNVLVPVEVEYADLSPIQSEPYWPLGHL
jgi:uncharacterized repeat protein (TIGR01451 family)